MKNYFNRIVDSLSLKVTILSEISVMAMMAAEFINAVGREFYMPLPCCLEMSESLMITSIFMAAAYVGLKEEHTNVTILTRRFPLKIQRLIDSFANLFGGVVFVIFAYGAWKIAFTAILKLEMRIGVFRFPIWPFRIFFAFGLTLLAFQFISNSIKCLSQVMDRNYKPE